MRKAAATRAIAPSDEYREFSSETMQAIIKALPEKEIPVSKMNNFEVVSKTGQMTIWPVYGNAWDNDEIGYYYYNPNDSANTYKEVTIFENTHDLGDNMQWIVESNGTTTYVNYNFGSQNNNKRESDKTPVRSKGYDITVPVGYVVGFYVHNRSKEKEQWFINQGWAQYMRFYTNHSKNHDGVCGIRG